jgi:BirA family biotin operon repressor/biotin-[acetyl-CoA-carboxylase] ligase
MVDSHEPATISVPGAKQVGRRVLVYDRLDSTNDLALALADDPANDGLVVVAREQTAGRGQHGRSWQSPPGTSVLLSAVLFPPPALRRPALLTAWAAVAVCDTAREAAGAAPAIKWPNDVLVGGRKVCGILIEQRHGTVVGLGLNVNQSRRDFDAAGLPDATSLALACGGPLDCEEVTRLLVSHLDRAYALMCSGDLRVLEESWRLRLGLHGRRVTAECHDGNRTGVLIDLGFGGLRLVLPGGDVVSLAPESVRHLTLHE